MFLVACIVYKRFRSCDYKASIADGLLPSFAGGFYIGSDGFAIGSTTFVY